jgi:Fe(II)/alpha-ketoglutarate-dependent arginine beta-hydroxylase
MSNYKDRHMHVHCTHDAWAREPDGTARLALGERDVEQVMALIADTERRFASVEDADFLTQARRLAARLPNRLRDFLTWFAREGEAAAIVRGLPANTSLGRTPAHWALAHGLDSARRDDIYLCLTASLLGEVFAWSTLQRGKLVTDVLPIVGEEDTQSGHGTTLLAWHTEDAFHPRRCEFLLLLCLRNPTVVPTTVATLHEGDLSAEHRRTLSEPRFYIRPDPEHVRPESSLPDAPDPSAVAPDTPVAVLSSPSTGPHLRIDPLFMDVAVGDAPARAALDAATDALQRNLADIPLAPGDLLVIDNRRAVHGRGSFTAKHDGGDRWLKKVMANNYSKRLKQPSRHDFQTRPWIVR